MYKRVNELLGTEYKSNSSVNWAGISLRESLSENFIREFKDYVFWSCISANQTLSESFIREFKDKVDWHYISRYQVLSESFIREFEDKVDWQGISIYQLLSWGFILEFENKLDWYYISTNQPFINNLNYKKIDKSILKYNKLYYLYQQTKERGWFWGYIEKEVNNFLLFNVELEKNYINKKGRIYWKDLIKTNKVRYFEFIRQVKYV